MDRSPDIYQGHMPDPHRRTAVKDSYPYAPSEGKTDTSAQAAEAIKPVFTKKQRTVLKHLEMGDFTNSEIFARAAGLSPDELIRYCQLRALERGLQPRSGELSLKGKIFDTGRTRKNPNGRRETVWSLNDPTRIVFDNKQGSLL